MSLYEPDERPSARDPFMPAPAYDGQTCPKCGAWTAYLSRFVPSTGRTVYSWPGGVDGRCLVHRAEHEAQTAAFRELERRRVVQAAAGIPVRYRNLSFRRADRIDKQPALPAERFQWPDRVSAHAANRADLERWQAAVRAKGSTDGVPHTLGVPLDDARVLKEIVKWKPSDGSMWVEGPPGTGKTAAVCARVNDIIAEPLSFRCQCYACKQVDPERGQLTSECRTSHVRSPPVRVVGGVAAMFVTEADLVSAMGAKRMGGIKDDKTHEMDVATRARKVQVLILDELGGQNEIKDWILDVMNGVINDRYNNGLPTLFTSNVPLSDDAVKKKYGERFVSRVRDSINYGQPDHRHYALNVVWRTQ